MTTRRTCRTIARLVAVSATIFSIGCAVGPTAPVTRSVQATNVASHDDPPSDTPCASGWQLVDGRWVCE
jgi:hypothetical protein